MIDAYTVEKTICDAKKIRKMYEIPYENWENEKKILTWIGVVVNVFAKKYVLALYQLLNVSFRTIANSVGTVCFGLKRNLVWKFHRNYSVLKSNFTYISAHQAWQLCTINMRCRSTENQHFELIYLHSNQNHRTTDQSILHTIYAASISNVSLSAKSKKKKNVLYWLIDTNVVYMYNQKAHTQSR